jgi:type IV fimbrial biogenesis protein FimT
VRRLKHGHAGHRAARGLTLIELMVGLAIAALLALAAAPAFGDYVANSRLREAGNLVFTEALAAQSEAIKRNTTVRLETDGVQVRVIDLSDAAAPVTLRERTLPGGVEAEAADVDFGSEGRLAPFGTTAAVNLTKSGITCSAETRCPGLRVDGGGQVRLCSDQTSC